MVSLQNLPTLLALVLLLAQAKAQALAVGNLRPTTQAVMRLEGAMSQLRLSPNGKLLAFTDPDGRSLQILDLNTNDVIDVSPHRVGLAFFWSPDSIRLFFRELIRDQNAVTSELSAYDSLLNRRTVLEKLAGSSGFPTFNPFNNTVYLIHEKGIAQQRLEFPGERPSRWQKQKKPDAGNWIVSQSAVLWLDELGLSLKKIPDDASGLQSFSISPDGKRIAWATRAGKIYTANEGNEVNYVGEGQDPSWHPHKALLVYAATHRVGNRTIDTDLRIVNLKGEASELTFSPGLHERWPVWFDSKTLLFTASGTTDLFRLQFETVQAFAKPKTMPEAL
ncbi:MAG: hypothetical protein NTX25_09175 [Proteobacteria bacterium]|nr:hypothetical protein [Pseudomonadota bacterium]